MVYIFLIVNKSGEKTKTNNTLVDCLIHQYLACLWLAAPSPLDLVEEKHL